MKASGKILRMGSALALLLVGAPYGPSRAPAAGKSETRSGTVQLRIEVTGGDKNQPVENASVYVRYVRERKKVEMNVKTNQNGVTNVPEIPPGHVLIQVIAEGWKTYGRWYELAPGEQTVKIHLEKPPRWY